MPSPRFTVIAEGFLLKPLNARVPIVIKPVPLTVTVLLDAAGLPIPKDKLLAPKLKWPPLTFSELD